MFSKESQIGVIGAGTMGNGIAQIAATYGNEVIVIDANPEQIDKASASLEKIMSRLVEKGRVDQEDKNKILSRISYSTELSSLEGSDLVIEAIIENLEIKKKVFSELEKILNDQEAVIATNTSSISIAAISSAFQNPDRFLGIHFFNPVPLMKLVEIIPSFITKSEITINVKNLMLEWGKAPAIAKDTPGFIVNRIARPFYSEGLRILEEGIADVPTIDWALKEIGGFRMGPFELMDFIGHDVNYVVTETVFEQFYFDPRFKPAITQKRLMEAGMNGRKSGRGFYNYTDDTENPKPNKDRELGQYIFERTIAMLINEATDAVFMNVASKEDIETAMQKGVNYPKGLLAWADEMGIDIIFNRLSKLFEEYGEDRYRPNPLLRKMAESGQKFFT